MEKAYSLLVVVILSIVISCIGCKKALPGGEGEQHIDGTKLKLVAEYKPLHIYIYADTTSTNELPDYAVFKGVNPVFSRENTASNTMTTTDYEYGFATQTIKRDQNERVLEREVYIFDNSGPPSIHQPYNLKYIYLADKGRDAFDKFIIFGTNMFNYTAYEQSNFCWVPIHKTYSLTKQP